MRRRWECSWSKQLKSPLLKSASKASGAGSDGGFGSDQPPWRLPPRGGACWIYLLAMGRRCLPAGWNWPRMWPGISSLPSLPVRVLVDRSALEPKESVPPKAGNFTIERDLSEYRGTGGLLANVAVDYKDDDMILVGSASQLLLDPLTALVIALRKTGGLVSLVGHREGTPTGIHAGDVQGPLRLDSKSRASSI